MPRSIRFLLALCALAISISFPTQVMARSKVKIHTEEISYQAGTTTLKGYFAWAENSKAKRPGVIVVHEWWGLNDYVRMRARKLAELGYVALALDMYGEGKTAAHPDDAKKFMTEVTNSMPAAEQRFQAGFALIENHPLVDPTKIAAMGYCFGGAVVLHMARLSTDLKAVASFHGNLAPMTKVQPGAVKAKVLVFTGADDPLVPADSVVAFKKEMTSAKADYEVIIYPGAKHSFTNPAATENGKKFNMPLEYNEAADKESWAKMKETFKQAFTSASPAAADQN